MTLLRYNGPYTVLSILDEGVYKTVSIGETIDLADPSYALDQASRGFHLFELVEGEVAQEPPAPEPPPAEPEAPVETPAETPAETPPA